ncbi:hypothetical protein LG047_05355 [Methylocystis sp. WRRC1]|uniref:hypothetical protein n=1 Tax=Methylocystis sp. WRRC1 TaxID=1732014 RepID=UPI001D14FB55|nr:hypothetical protein [Methylocystis sp. WRRC1]MCC3244751.1 hypothetical protein [Methylocystis sp. WRRC1]
MTRLIFNRGLKIAAVWLLMEQGLADTPNLLDYQFTAETPNLKSMADFTEIWKGGRLAVRGR